MPKFAEVNAEGTVTRVVEGVEAETAVAAEGCFLVLSDQYKVGDRYEPVADSPRTSATEGEALVAATEAAPAEEAPADEPAPEPEAQSAPETEAAPAEEAPADELPV